ncbi:hypothetical protein [Zavarzinella formosa]|uniref:hypothetical protein n=1 Tax=Zavarzinella formosa TaxID=360055 RepID=UPI00030D6E0F|nr:hypothetical protein [Zavarzinella formosa]
MKTTMTARTLRQRAGLAFLLLGFGLLAGCGNTPAQQKVETAVVEAKSEPSKGEAPKTDTPKPETPAVTAKIDEPKTASPKAETPPEPKAVAKAEPKTEAPKTPAEPVEAAKSFAFPGDTGGKLLGDMLTPKAPATMPGRTVMSPRERVLPAFLDNASVLLPDAASNPQTLRLPNRREIQPMSLPEKVAPDFAPAVPSLPAMIVPEVGALHIQPMRDPTQPAELPILSNKPVPERASLADPTVEFTAQSVISLLLPLRETTVPFVKLTIPEPFEFAGQATLKVVPSEDPNRFLTPPPAPKP